jgi:hypothetical protein
MLQWLAVTIHEPRFKTANNIFLRKHTGKQYMNGYNLLLQALSGSVGLEATILARSSLETPTDPEILEL